MSKYEWMKILLSSLAFFIGSIVMDVIRVGPVDFTSSFLGALTFGVVFAILTFFFEGKKKKDAKTYEDHKSE